MIILRLYLYYNKHDIGKFHAHSGAQRSVIIQRPLVEAQHTSNANTTLQPTYNVEATPTKV